MSRQVGTPKGAKLRADKLFSQIIRSRGACENCGATGEGAFLQCAHIISRRYANTRCDEDNALCLCARCHHFFTDHPVSFGAVILDRIGFDAYADLVRRSQASQRVIWNDVVQRLKLRAQELELV
jgi:hypothetical protein